MIIDSHVHLGKMLNFDMNLKTLIQSMDKFKIDFSLVSSIEATEFNHDMKEILKEDQISQVQANQKLIDIVKQYPDRIGALLWAKPNLESCDKDFEDLVINNRDYIYGLKFHPFHSNLPFDHEKYEPYFRLAERYDLVVVTHTASSYESSPKLVYEVAKKYPKINFVMVHMGLGTDNQEAIKLISKLPNLYGDSTWVSKESILEAIDICGIDKILFGSDNPIDGINTLGLHESYRYFLNGMKYEIDQEDYDKFICKNAVKLFKINRWEGKK